MLCHFLISCAIVSVLVKSQENELLSNVLYNVDTPIKVIEADIFLMDQKRISTLQKVDLKLFYESLCPGCKEFDPVFARVAKELHQYVTVHTYPYGNAEMIKKSDGSIEVECQHGVDECYGNMLHACAIDILGNVSQYLEYNSCMMGKNSNDAAAEQCGKQLGIKDQQVEAIKKCAKGPKGHELLIQYGIESKKVGYQYVPYVLIDNAEWKGTEADEFKKDVCAKFQEPPEPCKQFI